MLIQESGEMYLETIFILSKELHVVRSIDISERMGYSKPSVSRAMSLLRTGGYIHVDENGYITLLDPGLEIAKKIYERHTVISQGLISLGVSEATAIEDACKIEHVISDETFQIIKDRFSRKNHQ